MRHGQSAFLPLDGCDFPQEISRFQKPVVHRGGIVPLGSYSLGTDRHHPMNDLSRRLGMGKGHYISHPNFLAVIRDYLENIPLPHQGVHTGACIEQLSAHDSRSTLRNGKRIMDFRSSPKPITLCKGTVNARPGLLRFFPRSCRGGSPEDERWELA